MAVRYMNRFAVEEDDQFEIAAFLTVDNQNEIDIIEKLNKAMQAVKNLTKLQNQGMDYFRRILSISLERVFINPDLKKIRLPGSPPPADSLSLSILIGQ